VSVAAFHQPSLITKTGLLVPLQAKDIESDTKAAMMEMGEALKQRVEQHKTG
jgi:hypothetical protein